MSSFFTRGGGGLVSNLKINVGHLAQWQVRYVLASNLAWHHLSPWAHRQLLLLLSAFLLVLDLLACSGHQVCLATGLRRIQVSIDAIETAELIESLVLSHITEIVHQATEISAHS